MTLEEFWKITLRHWALLLVTSLVGLGLAGLYYATQTKQYTASTTAYVVAGPENASEESGQAQASMSYSNTMLAKQKAASWLPLFKSTPTVQAVISKLHLSQSPGDLASKITTTPDEEAPVITVSVTTDSPAGARDVANAVVEAAGAQVQKIEGANAGARIKLVANAQLPAAPSYPKPSRILPIGLLAGLLVGYVLALMKHRSDTRVRSQDDVEKVTSASVLAVIPQSRGLASTGRQVENSDFQTRESLRKLRTNLQFVDPDNPPRVIVVTSSRMGEGKTSVASNLARVLAASGERVLLVDADLRRPMVGTILDKGNADVGLSQLIAGTVRVEDVVEAAEQRNMFTITAGQIPPNPSELLGSKRMKSLLAELRKDYFVILDAPPLLPVTDAALLLPATDGAILVVEADKTRKEQLAQAIRNVNAVKGHVLGAVINRAEIRKSKGPLGNYGSYGNYGNYGEYGGYGEYAQEPVHEDRTPARDVPAVSSVDHTLADQPANADQPVAAPQLRVAPMKRHEFRARRHSGQDS